MYDHPISIRMSCLFKWPWPLKLHTLFSSLSQIYQHVRQQTYNLHCLVEHTFGKMSENCVIQTESP